MALNEFELINKYFASRPSGAGVALGIGDDCALLDLPAGSSLAVTVDTLVEGVHFPADADAELLAQRALRVNLSDLAAMGAKPLWFTLALTLPEADAQWLTDFSRGLFAAAGEYNCSLVGGDTTRGPRTISIQMMGAVEAGRALTRSGARAGDQIYVTGSLGDGAAALAVIQEKVKTEGADRDYLLGRYYRPEPRLRESHQLIGLASAAIDISDGLLADLGHICSHSGVGATLHLEQIPMSVALERLETNEDKLAWALSGGDDYELCFTVPPSKVQALEAIIQSGDIDARAIGVIDETQGLRCLRDGKIVSYQQRGYQHFDSSTENP